MKKGYTPEVEKIYKFLVSNADMGTVMDYDDETFMDSLTNAVRNMDEPAFNLLASAADTWLKENQQYLPGNKRKVEQMDNDEEMEM